MSKHREIQKLKRERQNADGAALLAGELSVEQLAKRNALFSQGSLPEQPKLQAKAQYASKK